MFQKCITKAKIQKGTVRVKFIKILFTGSGKAGKTNFCNLLMKKDFIKFHHSANIVQTNHPVQVKRAAVISKQSYDQSTVWLEMDDDAQINHLGQILLSLDSSPLPYVTQRSQRRTGIFQGSVKSENLACFNKLVQQSSNSTTFDPFYSSEGVFSIITLLDTGGHPEYINLLPIINVQAMVYFVVHDLSRSLQDQVPIEYSEYGQLVFEPYNLRYSNLDMIKFLISNFNNSLERTPSQTPQLVTIPGKNNSSYICLVGTHADKVSVDIIHNTDRQLTAIVEKLDWKFAIWQNKDGGVLFPVDNTTAGDDAKEDPIAKIIRSRLAVLSLDRDIYELPITWMLFELEIRQVCSNSDKACISFKDCCAIAHHTNLIPSTEEVRFALIYYHLLGVLLYYHTVPGLCDYVIVDHQWLFDRIYSMQKSMRVINLMEQFSGIVNNELIKEVDWKQELKMEYFINLLIELKIIAPIRREDGNGEDYFIPDILPTQLQYDGILSQCGYLQGEPLLIQFVSNLLPRGFFCYIVVQMLQRLPKHLGYHFTQQCIHHAYSNLITFCLQNLYNYYISLIDKFSYLEVQIRHQESNCYYHFPIHFKVQEILAIAIKTVNGQLSYSHARLQYGFHCQCGEYDEHIAILAKLTPPFDYAMCRYNSIFHTKLRNEHTVWLSEVR